MRNFGLMLLVLGVVGFLYAGAQLSGLDPVPTGLSVRDSLRQPAGPWELGRYVAAGAAAFGLLLAFFPSGR